ncbi:MAG: enoyl-CoA hydratase/isomerase family protein [Flavobacteriales bacterium]|nr:enoyl-CoA hydratase/isomerase family protein [Flavobacteriales bacterium]
MNNLLFENRNGIGVVTLNRGTANALNVEMIQELSDLFTRIKEDETVKAAIITGTDNFFSAGLDVIEVVGYNESESEVFWKAFADMMYNLASWPKPMACAINGHSPAGGCILAITADFRFMAEGNFKIGLNEVPVGIVVPLPVYKLYSMWVGTRNAYQFLIQGKLLNPQEALNAGLVDGIYPQEKVFEVTEAAVRQMMKLDAGTFAKTKLNLRKEVLYSLKNDFEESFGDTLKHWWDTEARVRLNALVDSLIKKVQ